MLLSLATSWRKTRGSSRLYESLRFSPWLATEAHTWRTASAVRHGPVIWSEEKRLIGRGLRRSTPGSRPFEIAIRPALLDLVSVLSLPPAILLRFTDRQRHELPGHKVAESALIRNRAVAQQLCEHAQSLVGQILVDERFLPG